MPTMIKYAGFRNDGSSATGAHEGLASEIAKELFDKGWISARLTVGNRVVGEVATIPGAVPHRIWWSE